MINLVYVSSAVKSMTQDELLSILKTARENNAKIDVTGMLLYHKGSFMQVLEGEESHVIAIYNKIARDPRHRNVLRLGQVPIKARYFSDWKMGFTNLHDVDPKTLDGFSDYLNESFTTGEFTRNPSLAYAFLRTFKLNALRTS